MKTHIEALTDALNHAGFDAKAWKNSKIYLNGYGKDISAYIDLDDPLDEDFDEDKLWDGCSLKVYSNCESQPGKWRVNRAKQIKHGIMQLLYSEGRGITAYLGDVCENWQDVIL